MKPLTLAWVTVALSLPAAWTVADDPVQRLTVMTWNLEWFFDDSTRDNRSELAKEKAAPGRDAWNQRRDAFAAAIASARPTIAAFQEVESQQTLWYLTRAIQRNHELDYRETLLQGRDYYTEQDVGVLTSPDVSVASATLFDVTKSMQPAGDFGAVTKHLLVSIEVPVGDGYQTIDVMVLHLRARDVATELRTAQAASINEWLRRRASTNPVIIMGDFNTEEPAVGVNPMSEIGRLIRRDTPSAADDLVDLHTRLSSDPRGLTHIVPGKAFDRILVSRELVEDQPGVPDLVLTDVRVASELNVRAGRDEIEPHFNHYWDLPVDKRDLSDHDPIIATFEVR